MLRNREPISLEEPNLAISETDATVPERKAIKQMARFTDYDAPAPTYGWRYWVRNALKRVFFPPILLWDAMRWTANKLFGSYLAKQVWIHPISAEKKIELRNKLHQEVPNLYAQHGSRYYFQEGHVNTHDGAKLYTLEVVRNDHCSEFIIHFNGPEIRCEQTYLNMLREARSSNAHVISFNHRGEDDDRKPRSENDLVRDGIAQVQRVLTGGLDPNQITLKGYSYGANVAMLVAKHFKRRGIILNFFGDRAPASLPANYVAGLYSSKETGLRDSIVKRVLAGIASPFIHFWFELNKWSLNMVDAYRAHPADHKDEIVVRPSKAQRAQNPQIKHDPITFYPASLHVALKADRKKEKKKLEELNAAIASATADMKNTTSRIRHKINESRKILRNARHSYKENKMHVVAPNVNPHWASAKTLVNGATYSTETETHKAYTAENFFQDFRKRIYKKRADIAERQRIEGNRFVPEAPSKKK